MKEENGSKARPPGFFARKAGQVVKPLIRQERSIGRTLFLKTHLGNWGVSLLFPLNPIAVVGMSFAIFACVCHAQSSNSTNAKDRVEIPCGSHKVAITCGKAKRGDPHDERTCVRNVLSFAGANGKFVVSKQPKNFRQEFEVQKTPTSIDCRQGEDGMFYVAVTFVAGPLACGSCSTADLFTEGGERLTINSKNLDRVVRERGIHGNSPIYIEEYGK